MTGCRSSRSNVGAGHRSALAGAALALAGEGHPVLPLHSPTSRGCSCGNRCDRIGKHPRGVYGLKHATTDPAQVEAWWWMQPSANVGMRTDGLLVFDVDGPAGRRSLEELQTQLGELPPSRTQRSGRGGRGKGLHLLYAVPDDAPVGNSTGALGSPDGLDLRAGPKGYIVAAPSLHSSGRRYRWLEPEAPIVPLPHAWLERLQCPAPRPADEARKSLARGTTNYGLAALRGEMGKILAAADGSRNETLNRSVFRLAQLVAAGELELEELERTALACALKNGLGRTGSVATIRSAIRAGLSNPRRRA